MREVVGGGGVAAGVIATLVLGMVTASSAQTLPPRFVEEAVFTGLNRPTVVRFHPDGRVFVAEKRGVIRVYDSVSDATPTTFVDIRGRVHNYWDRGLLGMALHPDFGTHPYVYVLYTLDAAPGQSPPTWGDECPNPPGGTQNGCVVQGRLSRFRAAGNVAQGAEEVLIQDWCQQFPSHSIGALAFGDDGALYVSAGDGASFDLVDYGQRGDPLNPCDDPPVAIDVLQEPPSAEGGALRSQDLRTSGDAVSLAGALLRVDPETGAAMPDNPLHGGATATDDRIIAFGLRNPFRFALRPGTREIWIGEVGWNVWEEIDVVADASDATVENFGWPCYEGRSPQGGYDSADLTLCEDLYAAPAAHTAPLYAYDHEQEVIGADGCEPGDSAISGVAFYDQSSFPAEYGGALFFADYGRNCIWTMPPAADGRPDPDRRRVFLRDAQGPVDLVVGPDGALYYAALGANAVHRIRYSNAAPFAQVTAAPTNGPVPLEVAFDASASSDPNGDPLTYAWDLDGDGTLGDASEAAFTHTFLVDGTYTVRLRVTDTTGAFDEETVVIDADNTAPAPTIDAPLVSTTWRVGDEIAFSGRADDAEEGALEPDALSWEIVVQHCAGASECHEHVVMAVSGAADGSFPAPDHPYPSHLEFRLTATDALGLTGTAAVAIDPETATLELTTEPPSLTLAFDGEAQPAPFTIEAIVGSVHSLSAVSPQQLDGASYELASWSDGADREAVTRLVTVPEGATALQAVFAATCGNGALQDGEECDDGNAVDGDCCSADCSFEPAGSACGDAAACTAGECDGDGACTPLPSATCEPIDAGCTDAFGCGVGVVDRDGGSCAPGMRCDDAGVGVGPNAPAGAGGRIGNAGADAGPDVGSDVADGTSRADAGAADHDPDAIEGGDAASADADCACSTPGVPTSSHESRAALLAALAPIMLRRRGPHARSS